MHWFDLPDLLPPIYRNIKSMDATAYVENIELLKLRAFIKRILDNFFVQTCDVQTIEYWEQLLDIKIYSDPTLENRRAMILLYLNNSDPITDPFVKQMMHDLFGAGNYTFEPKPEHPLSYMVEMFDASYDLVVRFVDWLYKVCPAHIELEVARAHRAYGEIFISSISPSQYMSKATASVTYGTGTVWLGDTQYTLDTMDL